MKPDFSEFSYGYAVTEELVTRSRAFLVAAPLFPSLYEEGQAGGGYDVKIPLHGIPLFLQFKLSDRLERKSAKEHQTGLLTVPYFRMHIRPNKHSDQHNLLLALEASGEAVFYIAPEFHLPEELNSHYLARQVLPNSAAFSPADIGAMPDDDAHYIAFERGASFGYRCSDDPVVVNKLDLYEGIHQALRGREVVKRQIGEAGLKEISKRMLSVLEEGDTRLREREKSVDINGLRQIVQQRSPLESAGYIARTFFDSELVILE